MKSWLNVIIICFVVLGCLQVHDLMEEEELATSQWIDLKEGEIKGKVMDDHNTPLLAQVRFYDEKGNMIKCIHTDLTGEFNTRLVEGSYKLEVSKGYEYEIKTIGFEVEKESLEKLDEIYLKRIVDWKAKDYISGDVYQHSQFSEDGVNTIKEMIYSNIANGLDFGALADYNTVDGNDEWISLGKELNFLALPAQEIKTHVGSYLGINTTDLINLTKINDEKIVENMIQEVHLQGGLIQVNEPNQNQMLSQYAMQFDAITIWNGQAIPPIPNLEEVQAGLNLNHQSKEKWFELLSSGIQITALGYSNRGNINGESDVNLSHKNTVFNEWIAYGWEDGNPRNYIKVSDITIDGVIEGLKKGQVFITNGPLMDITVNEATFGETLTDVKEAEISYLVASNTCSLEQLNIIADGKVIETIPLAEDVPTLGTVTLNLSTYKWIVFEVLTTSYKYAISNPIYLK